VKAKFREAMKKSGFLDQISPEVWPVDIDH
jgi:hypothetical protein